MIPALRQRWIDDGARVDEDSGRPRDFGDAAGELRSARDRVILADRSHLGRLVAAGPDILDLLHRLSTADVASLPVGGGRPTVLTTPKGRIVQRLFLHHLGESGVLMLAGPGGGTVVADHLRRFTFRERTGLTDVGASTAQLALIGPAAREAAGSAGLAVPDAWGAAQSTIAGASVHVLGGDGLSAAGVTVVAEGDDAPAVWSALREAVETGGGVAAGDRAVEAWRILQGLPEHGHELTEDHNPLEAGLWEAVSFQKGCYVGQEVVARLNTYDKVARTVLGLRLSGGDAPAPGTAVLVDGSRGGEITSAVIPPGFPAPVALAYLRRASATPGTEVTAGDGPGAPRAIVVEPPF